LPYQYRGGGLAVFRINNGQSEVLLGLRANSPGRGMWSFPGGRANDKERLMTAAVREFREETGIQLYRRYITKTGNFYVKNWFFEWNTVIIESTQDICIKQPSKKDCDSGWGIHGGEFRSLRWVPISEIRNYKLHHWVKNVINLYTNGKMTPYTPKLTKMEAKVKTLSTPKRKNWVKTIQRDTGESLLFDMAEMVLTKISRDGTKYYQSKFRLGTSLR
jgi:8-oxo-dGTP pyrophosphatase MutT (NUDIX family)